MVNKVDLKIFIDQDGVLADFDKGYKNLTGYLPKEFEKKFGIEEFWKPITKSGEEFWSNLEWMSDGKNLWYYVSRQFKPSILTAPSKEESSINGKIKWVDKHIQNLPNLKEIIFSRARDKKDYSQRYYILIDDNRDNIYDWVRAGGIGILHKSAKETIKGLQRLNI